MNFKQIFANKINNLEIHGLNLINKDNYSYTKSLHYYNYTLHQHRNRLKKNHAKSDNLIVQTQSGRVRGITFYENEHFEKHENKTSRVDAWLGIPFAEKPLGNLRFKKPVPIKGWDDILNATELPNTCYQLRDSVFEDFPGAEMWNPNTNVSEDCLYLNIWVPYPRPRNAAVMVSQPNN